MALFLTEEEVKREVDDETLRRADLIAVDSRDTVPLAGGDLLAALEHEHEERRNTELPFDFHPFDRLS